MNFPKQQRIQSANLVSRRHRRDFGPGLWLAGLLMLPAPHATAQTGMVTLAWLPSATTNVAGYNLYYGAASGLYTSCLNLGTNPSATVSGLAQGVTYYFALTACYSNGVQSIFSVEVTNRFSVPPSITAQPMTQTAVAGTPVTLAVSASGDAPLLFQWMNGFAPMAGATNPSLSWLQVGSNNAGNYEVVVSNPAGAVTSSIAALTVIAPPSILTQPQSRSVIATTAASVSAAATGSAPLSFQWYFATAAIAGATGSAMAWASVAASNAGNYFLAVSNAAGAVTSSVATLTVLPSNTIATVAGAYNGLFFQTNANGTPSITEATAGFLGNCVVASNGAYSAKIYLAGASCPLAGVFNISGSASGTMSLPGTPLSNVMVNLQLDLFNGSQQITGAVSSTTTGNAWTAPLLGYLATNACPNLTWANLSISAGSSTNAPTNSGAGTGLFVSGILSLAGALGDTAPFSQTVPICTGGNVPLYVSLYTNGGLLAGWVNLAGSAPFGSLTWIRPSGVLAPAGFPQGFNTLVQVGGSAYSSSPLVTWQALGPLRNNYGGPVGFEFQCQSNSTCRALGRWVVAGNTQTHMVALCSAKNGTVLAYATVATLGSAAGTYTFANLATPYAMTAGSYYFILSQESNGGDQWCNNGPVTTTSEAISISAADCGGTLPSNIWGLFGGAGSGQSYGPVNMLYSVP